MPGFTLNGIEIEIVSGNNAEIPNANYAILYLNDNNEIRLKKYGNIDISLTPNISGVYTLISTTNNISSNLQSQINGVSQSLSGYQTTTSALISTNNLLNLINSKTSNVVINGITGTTFNISGVGGINTSINGNTILVSAGSINVDLSAYTQLTTTNNISSNLQSQINEINYIKPDKDNLYVNVKEFGAIGDGIHDDTNNINNALATISGSGGFIFFPKGTYITSGILLQSYTTLIGEGFSSVIKLKNNSNNNVISKINDSVKFWGIRDLLINGNYDNNISGSGIYLYQGNTVSMTPDSEDHGYVHNVQVRECAFDGITVDSIGLYGGSYYSIRSIYFSKIILRWNKRDGFNANELTDTVINGAITNNNQRQGFRFTNCANIHMFNCKSFVNCVGSPNHECGFLLRNVVRSVLIQVESQEEATNGFMLDSCSDVNIQEMVADSNGRLTIDYPGFIPGIGLIISSCQNIRVTGSTISFHYPSWQDIGVKIISSNFIKIDITSSNQITTDYEYVSGNNLNIVINGIIYSGYESPEIRVDNNISSSIVTVLDDTYGKIFYRLNGHDGDYNSPTITRYEMVPNSHNWGGIKLGESTYNTWMKLRDSNLCVSTYHITGDGLIQLDLGYDKSYGISLGHDTYIFREWIGYVAIGNNEYKAQISPYWFKLGLQNGNTNDETVGIEFHSSETTQPLYSSRIMRGAGENSDFSFNNIGSGNILFTVNNNIALLIDYLENISYNGPEFLIKNGNVKISSLSGSNNLIGVDDSGKIINTNINIKDISGNKNVIINGITGTSFNISGVGSITTVTNGNTILISAGSTDLSQYTPLTTTANISSNIQSQINTVNQKSYVTSINSLTGNVNLVGTNNITINGNTISYTGSHERIIKRIYQPTHGFIPGDAIKFNGTVYIKAISDMPENSEALGMVEYTDSDNFTYVQSGFINISADYYMPGYVYFLSDTVPGGLTPTEPTIDNHVSKPLFIALSTSTGLVYNFRGDIVSNAIFVNATDAQEITGSKTFLNKTSFKSGVETNITIVSLSGNYSITDNDYTIVADTQISNGNITIVLPEYPTFGRYLEIKKYGNVFSVIIERNTRNIDKLASNYILTLDLECINLKWSGNTSIGWVLL